MSEGGRDRSCKRRPVIMSTAHKHVLLALWFESLSVLLYFLLVQGILSPSYDPWNNASVGYEYAKAPWLILFSVFCNLRKNSSDNWWMKSRIGFDRKSSPARCRFQNDARCCASWPWMLRSTCCDPILVVIPWPVIGCPNSRAANFGDRTYRQIWGPNRRIASVCFKLHYRVTLVQFRSAAASSLHRRLALLATSTRPNFSKNAYLGILFAPMYQKYSLAFVSFVFYSNIQIV